ncbi:LysR substrate-binding domain-containing protein [Reinekea marinisedimentorum]|uniref:DNA-binding transcriptional LysR family regulator n=1 Tax=Reinekea marinisedimentorum TaxID=230495 RepID=A0A4R3HZZ1_9GAMM|nr:LysR substrate-binding domain-containing protein [Reinekea marinisedimentorum]TCS38987.1 DNA-binding transcriptional LysR family regulator [Reinekea marinisedimentorum]
MNLSLRQLRLFEAIARLGQLTRAADEQAISQSAASQALRELESNIGYALFHRVGRELVITDSGRDALLKIHQILALAEALRHPDGEDMSGPLRIAASVTIACYLLPALLAKFTAQHPKVEPDIRITNTAEVIQMLETGQVQLGLIEGPATHKQLSISPWQQDELAVFCSPGHALASTKKAGLRNLKSQPWVLREKGSGTRKVFDTAVQQAGIQVKIALELNRQEAIKQAVKAGLGVGCLSALSVANEVARGELHRLETPLALKRELSVVSWPERERHPLADAFQQFLHSTT